MTIRIVVVDDTQMFREALCQLLALQADLEVVGQAGDGAAGVAIARQERPDVMLMDLQMPIMDGVTATRLIRAELPETQVITLTTFNDDDLIAEALGAGAVGYLLKDMSAANLIEAIRAVKAGGVLIAPAVAERLVAAYQRLTAGAREPIPPSLARTPERVGDLTPRETEILRLLAQGLSNREIADQLFLSEGTVKNYVSTIRSKLHARDRGQAIAMALRMGL
jgi:DNA-binding NarL/FixJ family response regulator